MHFHIPNMTCGNCVKHVTEAIISVDPVAKVEADSATRTIVVATTASREGIEQVLATNGYQATAI